jgi:4'-phosphopantetheinyl transferase
MDVGWLEQRGRDVPPLEDWLSAEETARLAGLRFPKRRDDWRLGRWTAKLAVCAWLRLPRGQELLRRIEIRPEPSGAPRVWIEGNPALVAISLSHREGTALCAIAPPAALGCDLEAIEPRSDAFVADYFTAEEWRLVEQAPVPDRRRVLALLWSAKESAFKAVHEGLRLDTRCANVTAEMDESGAGWHPLCVSIAGREYFHGWWRRAGGLVRTLVAAPPPKIPVPLMDLTSS